MKNTRLFTLALLTGAVSLCGCAAQPSTVTSSGWQSLVAGTTGMNNFISVGMANWVARDGAIQAEIKEKEAGYLVSKSTYGDFMIKAEFWVSDNANSGIFIRCADPEKITVDLCYEVNIYDGSSKYGTGSIVNVAKATPMPKASGKWSTLEITAQGAHLKIVFDGKTTVEADDSKLTSGSIALQAGTGVVKFRKVQIKSM